MIEAFSRFRVICQHSWLKHSACFVLNFCTGTKHLNFLTIFAYAESTCMMVKTPESFYFSFDELNISGDLLPPLMGYDDPAAVPEPVLESIDELLRDGQIICNIRGGYILYDKLLVDPSTNTVACHGQQFHTEKIVTRQLKGSEGAAWFLCTAGEEISGYSRRLMDEGDFMKGYVVDVLANVVVEAAMDRIQSGLKATMKESGLKITNRYSPGYCDWNIAEQKKLFSLFPENYLNIALSPSCLMIPVKSVSGIIGIGKDVKFNNYTCHFCSDRACLYRNKGRIQ
jgi:hypothetical protein